VNGSSRAKVLRSTRARWKPMSATIAAMMHGAPAGRGCGGGEQKPRRRTGERSRGAPVQGNGSAHSTTVEGMVRSELLGDRVKPAARTPGPPPLLRSCSRSGSASSSIARPSSRESRRLVTRLKFANLRQTASAHVDLKQDHGHRTIRRQLGEIIAKRRVIAFDDFVAVPITNSRSEACPRRVQRHQSRRLASLSSNGQQNKFHDEFGAGLRGGIKSGLADLPTGF
jgi:hypothetical protein